MGEPTCLICGQKNYVFGISLQSPSHRSGIGFWYLLHTQLQAPQRIGVKKSPTRMLQSQNALTLCGVCWRNLDLMHHK